MLIGLLFFTAQSFAQNCLSIQLLDGTSEQVFIADIRTLTFPDNNLSVNYTSGASGLLSLSAINKLYFSNGSGINNTTEASRLVIYPNPVVDVLNIGHLPEGENTVYIVGIDGRLLYHSTLTNGESQLNVSTLPDGFYILKVNDQAFKIRKQ